MTRAIPPRPYFTFSELCERWGRNESDVSYAIISGRLKPSVALTGLYKCVNWSKTRGNSWSAWTEDDPDKVNGIAAELNGWHFLQDPAQTGPFECEFKLAANARDPEKMEYPLDDWYLLKTSMSMQDVKSNALFLHKEVERYESRYPERIVSQPKIATEKDLGNKERNTLLCIIAALCEESKFDYKKHSKTAGLIQSTAARMGISIGETTIEEHLKKIPNALETRMK
ncbi:hypothetical protein JZU46_01305 [bacterium]|jgi:hypothetical protein|nr:hypothetical protein [bacterium]